MPKPRTRDPADKRRRIATAALRLFSRHGYDETSTAAVAEAAGQALVGTAVDDAAIEAAVAAAVEITDPVDDMRGPPEFRRHVAGVMTRRAIKTALSRAKGA